MMCSGTSPAPQIRWGSPAIRRRLEGGNPAIRGRQLVNLALIAPSDLNVDWHSRNNKLNSSTKQNILALHRGFSKIAMLTLPLTRSTLVERKLRHALVPKAGNYSSPYAPHQLNPCIRSCALQNDHRCHQCISVQFTQITPILCRSSPFHNAEQLPSHVQPP